MIEKKLNTKKLIPTDQIRNPSTILKTIQIYVDGRDNELYPIIVLPYKESNEEKYFICSGNHTSAAAHICRKPIKANVIETDKDLEMITEGSAAQYKTIGELHEACKREAYLCGYLELGMDEYIRDIFQLQREADF